MLVRRQSHGRHGGAGRPLSLSSWLYSLLKQHCAGRIFSLLALLLLPGPLLASQLERADALMKGGAPNLALFIVDQNQPSPENTEAWIIWEKQRYAIYAQQRSWPALRARVEQLPPGLPAKFVRWARTQVAWGEIAAANGQAARGVLRDLLWSGTDGEESLSEWRQMVIRSYLIDDNLNDAHTALIRYKQDYQADSVAWRLLHATILLRRDEARLALEVLAGLQTHEGRLHAQLAGLRSGAYTPVSVLAEALKLTHETRNKPELNRQAWVLTAEAAGRADNKLQRLIALERALTSQRALGQGDRLFQITADDLWAAYAAFAQHTGKQARLLAGKDTQWLKKAESYKRDDAPSARALYAFLSQESGSNAETRETAEKRLVDSLFEDGREEVVRAIYTQSSRYARLEQVPVSVRYRLLDQSLADYDIQFAAQLMQGLDKPPADEDKDLWALRRARVLIYAGDYPPALALLQNILSDKKRVSESLGERYLQVIFDLQAANKHAQVISLLESLFRLVDNDRMQREILFWTADSRDALGEHAQAAELYLRSATYKHDTGGDMWGQSARYQAAESLGKAGLIMDARNVFQALLKHASDPKQRALIERQIQHLWLLENKTTTP